MWYRGEPPENAAPKWTEGLPRGRVWNGSSTDLMLSGAESIEAIQSSQHVERLATFCEKYADLDAFVVSVTFLRHETWCLRRFNHSRSIVDRATRK